MTKTEIATRFNLHTGAQVTLNGTRGIVTKTSNIFVWIRWNNFQGKGIVYSYSELNAESEFTFQKL